MTSRRLSNIARIVFIASVAGSLMACGPVRQHTGHGGYYQRYSPSYDYWYYPSIGSYYEPRSRLYFYLHDDHWVRAPRLPDHLHHRRGDHVTLRSRHDRPYVEHARHRSRYAQDHAEDRHGPRNRRAYDAPRERRDRRQRAADRQHGQRRQHSDDRPDRQRDHRRPDRRDTGERNRSIDRRRAARGRSDPDGRRDAGRRGADRHPDRRTRAIDGGRPHQRPREAVERARAPRERRVGPDRRRDAPSGARERRRGQGNDANRRGADGQRHARGSARDPADVNRRTAREGTDRRRHRRHSEASNAQDRRRTERPAGRDRRAVRDD